MDKGGRGVALAPPGLQMLTIFKTRSQSDSKFATVFMHDPTTLKKCNYFSLQNTWHLLTGQQLFMREFVQHHPRIMTTAASGSHHMGRRTTAKIDRNTTQMQF